MKKHPLLAYVVRRFAAYLLTIWGSITIAFLFFHMIPGNPISALVSSLRQQYSYSSPESQAMIDAYMKDFGLDGSLPEQYVRYLGNIVLHFDFGPSLLNFPTHSQFLILRALPWTIGLLGISVLISWVLGVLIGGYLGWKRDTPASNLATTIAIALSQIPQYIVALILVLVFVYTLAWLPARDPYPANVTPAFSLEFFGGLIQHGILPALSIVIVGVAAWIISTRSLIVSILGEDYLLYAQSKGLPPQRIFTQYTLRNALLPQITGLAISLGFIVNGALLVETLFNYPGLGWLLVRATQILDYNTAQGIVLISIVSVLTANLLLDLVLPLVDPRIRREG